MPHRKLHVQDLAGLWPPTWPMGLTMLRLLLLPVFLWLILVDSHSTTHPHRLFAVAVFAVMAITDKLDGYLARRLKQTSRLGTILDPVADKLLIACSVILLGFDWIAPAGYAIPWPVIAAIYGKDLIVALGTLSLLSLIGTVQITPRWLGKTCTFLQLALVLATLLSPELQQLGQSFAGNLIHSLWWLVGIVSLLACLDYVRLGFRQFTEAQARKSDSDRVS